MQGARGRPRISTPAAARSSPMRAGSRWTRRSWTGATANAGAVTGVTATRNPISLARAVMERQPARLPQPRGRRPILARRRPGAGAARLFRDRRAPPPARGAARPARSRAVRRASEIWHGRRGRGRRAPAMSPPRPRPAASPASAGAGSAIRRSSAPACFADDRACAVSSTGAGEYFIRVGVAHEICGADEDGRRERAGRRRRGDGRGRRRWAAPAASSSSTPGGSGAFSFNTPGMYRGTASAGGPHGRHLRRRMMRLALDRSRGSCSLSPSLLPSPGRRLVGIWP